MDKQFTGVFLHHCGIDVSSKGSSTSSGLPNTRPAEYRTVAVKERPVRV